MNALHTPRRQDRFSGGKKSFIRSWGVLFFALALFWGFAQTGGPWIRKQIPIMDRIFTVIENQDINANAYFYTEIEESDRAERYLRGALDLAAPGEAGLTLPFLSGIAICIVLLWVGYKFLPMD